MIQYLIFTIIVIVVSCSIPQLIFSFICNEFHLEYYWLEWKCKSSLHDKCGHGVKKRERKKTWIRQRLYSSSSSVTRFCDTLSVWRALCIPISIWLASRVDSASCSLRTATCLSTLSSPVDSWLISFSAFARFLSQENNSLRTMLNFPIFWLTTFNQPPHLLKRTQD